MNYTIEQVLEEWKQDAPYTELSLQKDLYTTPNLHAKYLGAFVYFKAKKDAAEKKYNLMAHVRKKYYRGELTKEELAKYGWDQYQGLKMSNSEFNSHMTYDPILVELSLSVESYKTSVLALEYIMKQISQRDWGMKNIIEYQKWISGN
jgi:hypothetical protein